MHFALLERSVYTKVIFSGYPSFKDSDMIDLTDTIKYSGRKTALVFHAAYYYERAGPTRMDKFLEILINQHLEGNWNVYITTHDLEYLDKRIRRRDDLSIGHCIYDSEKNKVYVDFDRKPDICGPATGSRLGFVEEISAADILRNTNIVWGRNDVIIVEKRGGSLVINESSAYRFEGSDRFELVVEKITPLVTVR
jgi:hypothetical protein